MKKILSKLDFSYAFAFLGEATLALTFIFYILIARILGPEEYGVFAGAIALAAILSLFIQFGLPVFANREVAARPEQSTQSIALFLVVEGLTSLGVLVALLPLALVLGYREGALIICYLAVLAEVGRAMLMTLRGAIKGLGWFRAESIAVALERFTFVGLGILALLITQNLILVIAAIVVVRAFYIAAILIYLRQRVKIAAAINWTKIKDTLQSAYPFAIAGVLWILYYQVDVVMLKSLSTEAETGFYSASYRTLEMFSALPRVVFYVIFTRLSKYQVSAPERLPEQLYKAARLLILLVIPSIAIAGLVQTQLVTLLYGSEFLASVKSLSILLPSLAVKVFGTVAEQFLQATGNERKVPKILTAAATANIAINALLIPQFASVGAATATLLSECIMATLGLRILGQIGYGKASFNLMIMTLLSFGLASLPTAIFYGLSPLWAIAIALPSVALLLYRLKPKYFTQPTAVG
ncbi:MAG TPA: flippase [Candidatus Obscuribacterales bacterium]